MTERFNESGDKDRQRTIDVDQKQLETLGMLFNALIENQNEQLKGKNRRTIRDDTATVHVPLLNDQRELANIQIQIFTIIDGTTFMWNGIPTAVAYGQTDKQTPLLIGGAHYPSTVRDNKIDITRSFRFSALFKEFPGHFMTPVDYLAFFAACNSNGDLKTFVGDMEPSSVKEKILPSRELADPVLRKARLIGVTEMIGAAIKQKFNPTSS